MPVKRRIVGAFIATAVVVGLLVWVLLPALRPASSSASGSGDPSSSPGALSAQPSPTSPPDVKGNGWRLAFNGEFAGSKLNTSVWGTCYPWFGRHPSGCTNYSNNSYDWDLPTQDQVSNGVLHLVSQPIPTLGTAANGAPKDYACRSGIVSSYPSFRFTYGYVQVVARIPSSYGSWSSLWLAAANLNWPPEIDLVEQWGPPGTHTSVGLHPVGAHQVDVHMQPGSGNLSSGWHTISVEWTPTSLTWFIDGHLELSVDQHIPHQPMYFIANLADYRGAQGGKGCNSSLLVRSVKVWQH